MPKNRSLHIGVNYLDPVKYPFEEVDEHQHAVFYPNGEAPKFTDRLIRGWKGQLGTRPEGKLGCEKDAADMAAIAKKRGFEPTILYTTDATAERVKQEYENAAEQLEPGSIFFVTFAGHGCHAKDITDDEPDGYDESWCLHDRMFLDDEQRVLYSKFGEKGIRIVVLMDCCHSASGFRGTKFDSIKVPAKADVRGAPGAVDDLIYAYGPNTKLYNDIQAALPDVEEYYGVIAISACRDDQIAMGEQDTGGWFSNAVAAAFNKGKFKGNYVQFFDQVNKEIQKAHPGAEQEPSMAHPLSKNARKVLLEEGRRLTDDEWAKEVKILNRVREKYNEEVEEENRKRRKYNKALESGELDQAEDDEEPAKPKKLKELKPYPCDADELAELRKLADFLAEEFLPKAPAG